MADVNDEEPAPPFARPRTWPIVAVGTMSSAFPAFLTGALGVQLTDDVGLSATQIGLAMGTEIRRSCGRNASIGP